MLWLDDRAIAERLRALRENEAAWRNARDEGQFSLAGAQPKTALFFDDHRWGVPRGRTPTTHILKPPTAAFQGHAENEHVCLELARAVGLPPALSEVRRFEDEVAIVVERFDRLPVGARTRHAASRIRRIHQEDVCQALGVFPHSKYQNEGGPSPAHIARLLRDYSRRPAEDMSTFLDALLFNWIIGGTDAHAKNYALLHGSGSAVRLAPLYDVASALPYPHLDQRRLKLAMKIGGTYSLREVDATNLRKLAKECGAREDEMLERARRVARNTGEQIPEVIASARRAGLKHPIVTSLARQLMERSRICLTKLEIARTAPKADEPARQPAEYVFERMYVLGNRVVAELRAASGELVVFDPYRPGRVSVGAGDRVQLGEHGELHRVGRARNRGPKR